MNLLERKMLDILKHLRNDCGAVAVKAEFEAEGTRTDELLRLIEIARKAEMKFGLKIGGCEAIRDIIESKQIGVDYVIAPMVETPYALSKFIDAKNKIYTKEEQDDTDFLVNVETITGVSHIAEITQLAASPNGLDGLVFGRVDFVGSLGADRDGINSDKITQHCLNVGSLCRDTGLDLVVGGGVSIEALAALKVISENYLTRFETRKVIFSAHAIAKKEISEGLLEAVHFELLWLLNKRNYYSMITAEDDKRIHMLEDRWKVLEKASGRQDGT